ncbi:hypothetical protein CcaverHIS002_0304830 [Cutaneotrichosporon cavernicola]|uniref:Poly A polymerase C-terminal region-like protein n=1 Tax=Cutaneotrichosporon cavernicola TaxID=279322 RepID=A0AA48IIZ1_9TREE|nr:uncharacterized protein CcaverHIS019_0304780 [Cutaneotrichosporon cavernicola]BEI82615.1 hypothetical protein CcaverHIS002_0304830 [Cutaneotrichosporon cavernicola]BEI90408.1 hypothetical protein CcaverHIS019_0304780 [Cutaneotrichosporon cavernicola]BEI98184.1 hypothetical protein CcaverHIS631_0304830 [Cutaneotrichosporon cavernicola]BEJ05960.1 hypothetical protein CcaverHIS641_0304820 [Cutaneotrichosporon cavernicola]
MVAAAPVTSVGAIRLSETEDKFVTLLDEFSRGYNPPIECRIAGGWVRDKILNLPSHDLDVALSTTSGYAFAEAFVAFLHARDVTTGSVGRVAANPEQSKHLETGTTRVLGLECDFVGLRSETYTDSRIPDQVNLGTPLEDAERRDLTVNSLFFNVHSREVEDWTRHGLADLEKRIARTPLPPRQTFLDDPLRVLRCVRFASRFGLAIEPDVSAAIRELDIKAALKTKVSKERVGIETTKMLEKQPLRAMELIDELGLHSSIFIVPDQDVQPPHDRGEALKATQILAAVLGREGRWKASETLWLAAAACPFRGAVATEKKKESPAAAVVVSEGLKLSNELKLGVQNLLEAAKLLDPKTEGRARIGTMLQLPAVKPWESSVVWAVVDRILPTWTGSWGSEQEAILAEWVAFYDKIVALGLPESIKQPPLVNGKEVQKMLDLPPGQLIQVILKAINWWQLDHPEKTKEDAAAWVAEQWAGEARAKWEADIPPLIPKAKKKGAAKQQKRP